jgi:molybdopterin synthase catalytic subunit
MDDLVRLVGLRNTPLSVQEVLRSVEDDGTGGTALFVGTVRDDDHGRAVASLAYDAHPSAVEALREVAEEVATAHGARAVAALHRVGTLDVNDIAVVVAVACPHRAEAFAGCRQLIDELKARVPIWKHQRFVDGGEEWVGACES